MDEVQIFKPVGCACFLQANVVVAQEEYDRLTGGRPDFKKVLFEGPDFDQLDLARDPSPLRDPAL